MIASVLQHASAAVSWLTRKRAHATLVECRTHWYDARASRQPTAAWELPRVTPRPSNPNMVSMMIFSILGCGAALAPTGALAPALRPRAPAASRNDGDNFHILLLNETFAKPRMSVAYAAGALTLVLAMPEPDAVEHAGFAQAQGFSCLGTWRKDECLELCEQLRGR